MPKSPRRKSSMVRRKSDGKLLSRTSKAGKRVLSAQKAARTRWGSGKRRSRSRSAKRRSRSPASYTYKGTEYFYDNFPPLPPYDTPSPCVDFRKSECDRSPDCNWRTRRGCIRKARNRIEYWLSTHGVSPSVLASAQQDPVIRAKMDSVLENLKTKQAEIDRMKSLAQGIPIAPPVARAPLVVPSPQRKQNVSFSFNQELEQAMSKIRQKENEIQNEVNHEGDKLKKMILEKRSQLTPVGLPGTPRVQKKN